MKNTLTIAYCSCRDNPEFEWFMDSLASQLKDGDRIEVLYVKTSHLVTKLQHWTTNNTADARLVYEFIHAKPTVWSGPSRLTKEDWWSKSNSLNTALCHAKGDFFCTMDDRSVLQDGWLEPIRKQMSAAFPYVLSGSYEKRVGMTVEHGVIKHGGTITGVDNRMLYCKEHYEPRGMKPPYKSPSGWTYGVTVCAPLDWYLNIGGFEESCDGLSGEDYVLGTLFHNNNHPIFFDPSMKVVEDRTAGMIEPQPRRSDYGESPNDYSHYMLDLMKDRKTAMHGFDIRKLRDSIQRGEPWPEPWGPTHHAWTKQPLSELKPK